MARVRRKYSPEFKLKAVMERRFSRVKKQLPIGWRIGSTSSGTLRMEKAFSRSWSTGF